MFLHSGASLHGHEYSHRPMQSPTHAPLQRKRPFLPSAFPAPILRSATATTTAEKQPLPQTPIDRRRPLSEVHVQPVSDLFNDEPHRASNSPVVRFKDPETVHTPKSSMTEDDPSVYDSDNSQATSSVARRRRRRLAPRKSTTYLLAVPAPKHGAKKHLFTTIRPRLLLQLQELTASRRPRPFVDVFPASLIAGPLVTARYISRFPRIFGAKGELGPRDLILVKSEEYDTSLAEIEEDDENGNGSGRREPVAVLSPVKGQDCEEIVLGDGSVWTARLDPKGHYSFDHIDKHGVPTTARWVKRGPPRATPATPPSRPVSPTNFSPSTLATNSVAPDSDYKFTFSIINPLSRRHPILANLTPTSLEVYEDYTTVSSSQGRHPPTRPVSCVLDSVSSRSPPLLPFGTDEPSAERQTQPVDEATKNLIVVTGLWLALRLGPTPESAEISESAYSREPLMSMPSGVPGPLPRRQTTNNASSAPSLPPTSIKRALSTGAAFMQKRMQKRSSQYGASNGNTIQLTKLPDSTPVHGDKTLKEEVAIGISCSREQKEKRRVSWLKKLTH